MSGTSAAVFAIYPTHATAEAALSALKAHGIAPAAISVAAFPRVRAGTTSPAEESLPAEPAHAQPGVAPAIGVAIDWLVGISTVAVSGAMLVVAGPLMVAFKGVSATMLGIADALVGVGIPSDQAQHFHEHVHNGSILLSVHGDEAGVVDRGREIFEQAGAEHVSLVYLKTPVVEAPSAPTHVAT
jgi:hypothetical protein